MDTVINRRAFCAQGWFKDELMRVSRSQAVRVGVATSLGLVTGIAAAVPAITSIVTGYSALGTPTTLTIWSCPRHAEQAAG